MDTHARLHETISALADGELAASELELAFAALDTEEGRLAWEAYRRIGDVLRSDRRGHELSADFDARLAACLAGEAASVPAPLSSVSAPGVPPGLAEPLEAGPLVQR
ncbi:RseA family anti-sigma factor [Janthinobacterium sp. 1_2014MBL_MicDiv]|uniref:RseA family anti-sigma factor n=1 Tax=Janthinobacterium sp. 1_2014MBL_MicDiv TaxID=1644131 RepID=UPI0008F54C35|nr:RseA family anti-sigma factor [Janthinobacterium sp. 1_2014MBL_MicDiv]APA67783.1 sigma factor RpoE negative regulatory protein [Janthinobacterium sp. 1_2014MBL_MicDiv]